MQVVKVGGSLYDLPDLPRRLRAFVATLGDLDWLLVPGGGAAADVIRDFDRLHDLGPERSHWLALRACQVNAYVLLDLLPECRLVATPEGHRGPGVLDPFRFVESDDGRPGCLPHTWDSTSDSVAARAAVVAGGELVLLKSVTIPAALSWELAAELGYVDRVLPEVLRAAGITARSVNLRDGDALS